MNFSHSGCLGDIVYHLPVIRHLGGGRLLITPLDRDGYRARGDMQYRAIRPLAEAQPYITACEWADGPVGVNFERWRAFLDFSLNLTDQAAAWLGLPVPVVDPAEPWLEVGDPIRVAPVVFSRSTRNNFPGFPWGEAVRKYRGKAAFLGTPDEHRAFVADHGDVPYHPTADLLVAARVIAGSQFLIGNPSGLLAVAEGLKHRCIASSFPAISHCVYFPRYGQQHCWGDVKLWDLE